MYVMVWLVGIFCVFFVILRLIEVVESQIRLSREYKIKEIMLRHNIPEEVWNKDFENYKDKARYAMECLKENNKE